MAKRTHKVTDPKRYLACKVEVPRICMSEVIGLSWVELIAMAEAAGWRIENNYDEYWGNDQHAMFREGDDRMKGIAVLHYQRW